MATTKVAIDISVNAGEGAKSLKDLKTEVKSLTNELSGLDTQSKEYNETLKKIANTKDEIDDLNGSIRALTGAGKFQAIANIGSQIAAGFGAAQGAMALFGAESKDVEKALLKIQAAQALLAGFKELEGMADAANEAKMALMDLWKTLIANPMAALTGLVIAGGIALLKYASDVAEANSELGKMKEQTEALKGATAGLVSQIDIQIKSLEGLKSNEAEILRLQKEKLALNALVLEQEAKVAKAQMERTEKALKQGKSAVESAYELVSGINLEAAARKALADQKKAYDEANLKAEMAKAEIQAFNNQQEQKKLDEEAARKKAANDKAKELKKEAKQIEYDFSNDMQVIREDTIENELKTQITITDNEAFFAEKRKEITKEEEDYKKLLKKRNLDFTIEQTSATLETVQSLTNTFAGKSEEAQRRAFNINKAAQIAQATLSAIRATQDAYASQMSLPDPSAPIRAAIAATVAGVAGFARVAAIAKTQFNTSGGGGGSTSASGGGGGSFSPSLSSPISNTSTLTSNIGQTNTEKDVKVYVTETDISKSLNNVNKIVQKSLIE